MSKFKLFGEFKLFVRANSYFFISAWKKHKSYYFIYILNIFFASFNSMLFVVLPKLFLNAILEEKNFIKGCAYITGAILFSLFYSFWERKSAIKQNLNLVDILLDLKSKIYDKITKNNMLSFEDNDYYDSITKAMTYTESAGDSIIKLISDFIAVLISIVCISYIIARVNPFVVVALFTAIILAHLCMRKTNKMWFEYQQNERLPRVRLHNFLTNMFMDKNFVSEIKINGGLKFIKRLLLGNSLENAVYEAKKDSERFKWNFTAIILNSGQQLISYIYFGYLLFKDVIDFATYSTLFAAIQQFTESFNQLLSMNIDFSNKIKEANLYINFLNDNQYVSRGTKKLEKFKEIHVRNVKFSYPGQTGFAINNISLKIKSGEKIAIVGKNGSGKTTFIKMLLGLLPPLEGHIIIDNVDYSELDMSSLLLNMSAAMQKPFYLPIEIQKNITFSFDYNEGQLIEALKFAGISNKINKLPNKWDSILTKQFSKSGVDLSDGEKQKIALARAFYNRYQLLILDEPSSALDAESEYELFQNIKEINKDKTVIYISHRLSTTVSADKIIVFDNGSVVEEGTHDELMKNKGIYADLFSKQAQYYSKEKV